MSNNVILMPPDVDVQQIPTIFDPTTCVRKGLCPVTQIRKQGEDPLQSHSLYFEQHGTGSEKILFIMGLNSTSFSWFPQVDYFGREPGYSILVFDNRGVGNSGVPKGPYSTSSMAEDVIVLLDYVGWTAKHDLHVVGISLGGMIALELASRIPDRVVSLTLAVTRAKRSPWTALPSVKGMTTLARLLAITDPEAKIPLVLDMVFPQSWLNAPAEGDPEDRTNREVQTMEYRRRFEVTRPQNPIGALSQMVAGLTHSVSPERLSKISASVPKVLIVTGDDDHLVDPSNSRYMKEHMPEAELVEWEGVGHALQVQCKDRFNQLLERIIREGRERLAKVSPEVTSATPAS
ncbi:alpha/beta-hydrolase [Laetiporus sulphureus 93-53]|uniref:Alpha/beta-hydrolase n=1 Tax=Laetiporus sulphureus 93-53 TaxID=1314785 RepID=A0A165CVM7_9APHY|nr:alpha/beta-hydrolase [Laetiporus sulphureus 93-53]KZT03511.1 alpha/beta-hydrolase [Laetiporus sulphureus 93-53]